MTNPDTVDAERKSLSVKLIELERLIAKSPNRMTEKGAAYKALIPGWARSVLERAADALLSAPLPSPRADVVTPKDGDGDTLAKIAARQQAPFPLYAPVSMDEIRVLRDWMVFASSDREYLLAALARKPSRAEVVENDPPIVILHIRFRPDGGLRVLSPTHPGLILSGPSEESVWPKVWPAIRALASNRTGE